MAFLEGILHKSKGQRTNENSFRTPFWTMINTTSASYSGGNFFTTDSATVPNKDFRTCFVIGKSSMTKSKP